MRLRLTLFAVLALALPLTAGARPAALKVVFTTASHTPTVNKPWRWSVTAKNGGKAVAGTVTAQVVDPVGGVHAVQFGGSKTKYVTNVKFKGRFSDFVLFPPISRGVRVTFRVTVKTALGKRVVNYWAQAK
jgi:hypothetical protein